MKTLSESMEKYEAEAKLQAYINLFDELSATTSDAAGKVDEPDGKIWRRIFVQTLYALIETEVITLKTECFVLWLNKKANLTRGDVHFLRGLDYVLSESGEVHEKRQRLSLIPDLKYALQIFAKANELQSKPSYKEPKYSALKPFIDMRNRIVHPKKASDIHISDKDIDTALNAYEWFMEHVFKQRKEIISKLSKNVSNAEERLVSHQKATGLLSA